MNLILLYLLLLKATVTSFSGLTSMPVVRNDLVEKYHVLTDRQLNAAVAAGRSAPGPNGLYIVSVGYFVAGVPGACMGCLAARAWLLWLGAANTRYKYQHFNRRWIPCS